jgi:heterodisulfide reductase subunit A
MAPRVGVYVCHCGTNIADKVRVEEVVQFAEGLPNVVLARDYRFMCSEPGQEQIRNDIKEHGVNRVVVAACSPRMHEGTFRKTCEKAGINPYFLQVANIREQCSWTVEGQEAGTEKAKDLVRAAAARVALHQALPTKEVAVHPDVLVVGGGIAGIQAALDVADGGYGVHLVERLQSIGGHMAQLDKTFPTLDCSSCILTPKMVAVGMHPLIQLHTYSEVVEVCGYVGNFRAKIRHKAAYVDHDKCTGCGICQEKCPKKVPSAFDEGLGQRKAIYTLFPQAVPNKPVIDKEHCLYFEKSKCRACEKFCEMKAIDFQQEDRYEEVEVGSIIVASGYDVMDPTNMSEYGYGRYPNVITALEFERLVSSAGPTGGKILLEEGSELKDVAIIHCVGSRDKNHHEYCSRVCCMYALKYAHLIREKTSANPFLFYIDMRCFGKGYEEFYERVQNEGAIFVRGKAGMVTNQAVYPEEEGRLVVMSEDTLSGETLRVPVDMVILASAMEPRSDANEVARTFLLGRSRDGFFSELHPKLAPVSTPAAGIFLAGTCQGPKDIPDTVAHASAAAAKALSLACRGKVEVESMISEIDPAVCSGCQTCVELCPYGAITFQERRGISQVTEALCQGCGACAAACPNGAARLKHFTVDQILAEIDALMGA